MRYTPVGVSVLALLSGCGWFDSDTPSNSTKVRPGADRQVSASSSLPPAGAAHQYEGAIAPVDETRNGPKIGSLVPDKGGQKKQLEAVAKEAAEHDKQAREAREKAAQETAERQAKEPTGTPIRKSQEPTQGAELPTQPSVPPRAPVTSTPVSPPSEPPAQQSAAPPPAPPQVQAAPPPSAISTAPTPEAVAPPPPLPVDPNKAFSPSPGWAPPSQAQPDRASTTLQATAAPTKMPEVPATPLSPPSAPVPQTAAIPTSTPPAQVPAIAPVPANPNKAFEPPPGWLPPGQTASAPSSPTAAALVSVPRPALTPASPLPERLANPNKAAEPPVGWTPPAGGAAPLPAQTSTAAPSPAPPSPVAEPITAQRADPDGAFGTPNEQGAPEAALSATTSTRPAAAPPAASPAAPSPAANMASVAPRTRAPNPASPPPVATVFFARQSADITDDGKAELARLAKSLKNARQLELHGYAGDGDPVDDRRVALARALAVRSHLIDLGVTPKMDLIIATLPRRSDVTTEHVDIVIPSE